MPPFRHDIHPHFGSRHSSSRITIRRDFAVRVSERNKGMVNATSGTRDPLHRFFSVHLRTDECRYKNSDVKKLAKMLSLWVSAETGRVALVLQYSIQQHDELSLNTLHCRRREPRLFQLGLFFKSNFQPIRSDGPPFPGNWGLTTCQD